MSKQSDRRQELAIIEAEATTAIKSGKFQPSGNWFMSLLGVCFMLVLPIGFTWACLDFSLEANAFNIVLYLTASLLIAYAVKRIIIHAQYRHKLTKVVTNLPDRESNKLFAEAAESLGYRVYDYSKYRTRDASKLKMTALKLGGYRVPNKEITALFGQDTIYLHAQTVSGGDESILFNRNKQMIEELVAMLNKQLTS